MKLKLFLSKLLLVVLSTGIAIPTPLIMNIAHADGDALKGVKFKRNNDADTGPVDSRNLVTPVLRTSAQKNKDMANFFAEKLGCPNFNKIEEERRSSIANVNSSSVAETNSSSVAGNNSLSSTKAPATQPDLEIDEDITAFSPMLQNLRIESLDNYVVERKALEISELDAENYHEVIFMLLHCFETVPQSQEPITRLFGYLTPQIQSEIARNQDVPGFEGGYVGNMQLALFMITLAYGGYKGFRAYKNWRLSMSPVAATAEANIARTLGPDQRSLYRKMADGISSRASRAVERIRSIRVRTPRAATAPEVIPPTTANLPAGAITPTPTVRSLINGTGDLAKYYSQNLTREAIDAEVNRETSALTQRLEGLLTKQNSLAAAGNIDEALIVKKEIQDLITQVNTSKLDLNNAYKRLQYEIQIEFKMGAESLANKTIGTQSTKKLFESTKVTHMVYDELGIRDRLNALSQSDFSLYSHFLNNANESIKASNALVTAINPVATTPQVAATPAQVSAPKANRLWTATKLAAGAGILANDFYLLYRWFWYREYEKKTDPSTLFKAAQARVILRLNSTAFETVGLLQSLQRDIQLIESTEADKEKNNADLIEAVNKVLSQEAYQTLVKNGYYGNFTVDEKIKANGIDYARSFINHMDENSAKIQATLESFHMPHINVLDLKALDTQLKEKVGLRPELVDQYLKEVKDLTAMSLSTAPVMYQLGEAARINGELRTSIESME